jgi:NADPH-dependent 2,4-dienoyl-CoA reductase/sulfur reductase-like enzyme/Pyruvate/2-oxoacid:ferredoxin oxidoreductase delta subunit/bacterioferritin-associated ferredoxin
MSQHRITQHPVLDIPVAETVTFYWQRRPLPARRGEMISSALIANGVKVFGRHHRDGTGQGLFCANGQCSKCMVIANGRPVKSCMTPVRENMVVDSCDGLPELPAADAAPTLADIPETVTDVLVIGGGPAGLSAAIELGRYGIRTLLVDDKNELGGKLVLQTHKFFGSVEDSRAGTRGNRIGQLLGEAALADPHIEVWLNSTVVFVFSDRKVGVLRDGAYRLVRPRVVLNAAGAREKYLQFPGNHLVGVFGAGAFQTLANRDRVRPSERLFIVGGGNVGLIAGYHALQAGIPVVGLAEAMPRCGGYQVHADKLARLGVPIYTSHSIVAAGGAEAVESVTIARVDERFRPVPGTEKTFACDTILIAVGLNPIDEFTDEARAAGLPVFAAGDALEIAEASSAMFNGRIAGLQVARELGAPVDEIPAGWYEKAEILKSHPGPVRPPAPPAAQAGVAPVIHCRQEIPCNPCATVCPTGSIRIDGDPIMGLPRYEGSCTGCARCVAVCPGLAITLVDARKDPANPTVMVPYELSNYPVAAGDRVPAVDIDGNFLGDLDVVGVVANKAGRMQLVRLKAPPDLASRVVSFRIQDEAVTRPMGETASAPADGDGAYVCLCERVRRADVRALARRGVTDVNMIKAVTRAGMGACGSKTCETMIRQVLREEGVPAEAVTPNTRRPVFVEVPLGVFAGESAPEDRS